MSRKRKQNVDIDEVAGAGARYRRAVEKHAQALSSGEGTALAVKEVKLARQEFRRSLSPGVPLTIVGATAGAALGALVGRSIGAAIGAVLGGIAPTAIKIIATNRAEGS